MAINIEDTRSRRLLLLYSFLSLAGVILFSFSALQIYAGESGLPKGLPPLIPAVMISGHAWLVYGMSYIFVYCWMKIFGFWDPGCLPEKKKKSNA